MELNPYIESVRAGVQNAAALADDHTKQVAEHLGTAVESASRLALLQAISDAAAEISVELAPGSVEVRMAGSEPVFVVSAPSTTPDQVTMLMPQPDAVPADEPAADATETDEAQARVSLRLPQSVKEKVDQLADADGVSTNTWLLHRILEALAERTNPRGGWGVDIGHGRVRLSGPTPPTPPVPPIAPGFPGFPTGFPFDSRADRGDRGDRDRADRDRGDRRRDRGDRRDRSDRGDRDDRSNPGDHGNRGRGSVQGWVR